MLLPVYISFLFGVCVGLYEDQTGKYDWRRDFVGEAKVSFFDETAPGKRLIVSTEKNVVAAINVKNGDVLWRRVQEEGSDGEVDALVQAKTVVVSVSGGGQYVRAWLPATGHLAWEVVTRPAYNSVSAVVLKEDKSEVAVLSGGVVTGYRARDGKELWSLSTFPDSEGAELTQLEVSGERVLVVGLSSSPQPRVYTAVLDVSGDGASVASSSSAQAYFLVRSHGCVTSQGSRPLMACVDGDEGLLWWKVLGDDSPFAQVSLQELGVTAAVQIAGARGGLLIARDNCRARVLGESHGVLTTRLSLPSACAVEVMERDEQTIVMSVAAAEKSWTVSGHVLETGQEVEQLRQTYSVPLHTGRPLSGAGAVVKGKGGDSNVRLAVLADDHSLHVLGSHGSVLWRREEALASIVSVEMVDPPLSAAQARMEGEFSETSEDLLSMMWRRVKTQLELLEASLRAVARSVALKARGGRPSRAEQQDADLFIDPGLVRDDFNMRKVIVVVTAVGKLYGLDSADGSVIWQHYLRHAAPFPSAKMPLFMQRTTAFFPHPAQCLLVAAHKTSGEGLVYMFNPVTGQPTEGVSGEGSVLGYTPQQATMLQHVDPHHLRPVLVLDDRKQIHVFPREAASVVSEHAKSLFMFTADKQTGVLSGFRVAPSSQTPFPAREMWQLSVPTDGHTITSVALRNPFEQVHSPGKVLADRSVLYKYVNPNLAAVTTEGSDPIHGRSVSVMLVDTVTGHLVFNSVIKKAVGPVQSLVSENWVLVSYYNSKSRRSELLVMELFEGNEQANATVFSSLHGNRPPVVLRQSYILSTRLSAMAVTLTEKGISAKFVLVALKIGSLLSLPKPFLDPRRLLEPTMELREEGVLPYVPELPVSNEQMPSYNQTVERVVGIHTAPAGLESTSLVFAHGLDLFYTKVNPSQMFDQLKEDFDHVLIGSVLLAMVAVTVISQKLAARKGLKRAWK